MSPFYFLKIMIIFFCGDNMTKFKFKKRYGQNFLIDTNIIDKIINSIDPTEKDLIIEIGPGAGALTKKLKKYSANLIAFEIDEETKKYLSPLENSKTKIIYGDFLETDIKKYISEIKYENIYIIGNLPYYITTPIIEHIIDSAIEPKSITIMVQKEVGDRFLAKPGIKDYGYMTVLLNYNFTLEYICSVPRKCFQPAPNVDSTVLKLTSKTKAKGDYNKFKKIIKDAFQFKRKTIYNNLKNYDKEKLEIILTKHGYSLTSRAETIDLETYIELTNNL